MVIRPPALILPLNLFLACCLFVGCGQSENTALNEGSPEDAFFNELLEQPQEASATGNSTAQQQQPKIRLGRPQAAPEAVPSESAAQIQQVAANTDIFRRPQGERLQLNLQVGDRFPLIKTVRQGLIQESSSNPLAAETALQLTLAITVEEVSADGIQLGVRYSRVIYEHDIDGRRLRYDSMKQQDNVPWEAIPYAGMINNGFSFRLNPDNTIQDLIGYKEFLERCVARVPMERRETLLSELSNRFGDDGVANFIDDSIGLLPYDGTVDTENAAMVMQGDIWTRERRLMHPIPVYLKSTCTLTDIDSETARIEITGRIASGEATTMDGNGRLRVSSGRSLGHCIVDRRTGLPTEVELTRHLTIQASTADGEAVTQRKTVLTTMRTFPESAAQTVQH